MFQKFQYKPGSEKKDNRGKQGKGGQGTGIKDPWTKPKRGRIECGRWGLEGEGKGDNCT